jgi:methionine-gamma-lyase
MSKSYWKTPPRWWNWRTKAAHTGYDPFLSMGAVRPPIFACSTFATENADKLEHMFKRAYGLESPLAPDEEWPIYTRVSNPNFLMLDDRLQFFERGSENARTVYFPSGLSAIFTTVLSECNAGDVLVFGYPVYGGTDHMFRHLIPAKLGVNVIPVNATRVDEVEKVLKENAGKVKIVFIETPANPNLAMVDMEAVADLTHRLTQGIMVVDNTFMSPILQHPFEHGADIIVYSGTKSIGGHSDLISGFVIDRNVERAARINSFRVITGPTPSAFDAWLLFRSLDTLELRVMKAQENAKKVATFLSKHPKVKRVVFPELLDKKSEQWKIYKKQCDGPGSMITFDPVGGKTESYTVLDNLKVFTLAVSLGGVESLAENPWYHTHSDVTDEDKLKSGFSPETIRLSVGLEDADNLCADLDEALKRI